MTIIERKMYDKSMQDGSFMSGNVVEIIGEQTIEEDGEVYEQYLYNIVGYTPKNGKPFVALKSNLVIF